MRNENLIAIEKSLLRNKEKIGNIKSIAMLSPSPSGEENAIIQKIFPEAWTDNHCMRTWNISVPQTYNYDLIVACNVFMYSDNPQLWFDNLLNSGKFLFIQDVSKGWRGGIDGRGDDGDSTRFHRSPKTLQSCPVSYDLAMLKQYEIDYEEHELSGAKDVKGFETAVCFTLLLGK